MGRSCASASSAPVKLNVQGLNEPVEIRHHPAARRLTLRVSRTQRAVIVTLPMQCNLKQAGQFLTSHLDWVRERLTSMPSAQPFAHDGMVAFRGILHRIVFCGKRRGAPVVEVVNHEALTPELYVSGDFECAPRRLRDWLISEARKDLEKRVAFHAQHLGLKPGKLTMRDQTSRWGSCSSYGNLSFSWRLIMAPSTILDYVAAHEVAHLAEMNHSPRFWALVKETCPMMDDAKNWLDAYGLDLHRYGAQS